MLPGTFVQKLAEILGEPAKSVVVVDRALLEAGLRSRGGRGRSAVKVTTADAAILLLAVMATPVLIRADEAILPWLRVKSLGRLPEAPRPFGSILAHDGPLPLLVLMERLIELPPDEYNACSIVLDVSADQHLAMLRVRRKGMPSFEVGFLKYLDPAADAGRALPAPPAPGDLTRSAKVTEVTFQQLHRLFFPAPGGEVALEPAGRPA